MAICPTTVDKVSFAIESQTVASSVVQFLLSVLNFDLDTLFDSLWFEVDELDSVLCGCKQHVAFGVEFKCMHWSSEVQVEHLGALGVVVLHLPDCYLAVLAAQCHA